MWDPASVGLPKATRLKGVTFRFGSSWGAEWVTALLRTITPEHRDLRQISISMDDYSASVMVGADVRREIGDQIRGWLELDRLLVQLWESHSIRPKILCCRPLSLEETMTDLVGWLLPETTRGGIVDPVDA